MLAEVVVKPLTEALGPQEILEHPQHGCTLAVTNGIEQLPDLRRVLHFLMYRMGVLESVQIERAGSVRRHEASPRLPIGE